MPVTNQADVAVIGGGILGLAFAWEALRRGRSVVIFERNPQAQGASIRNFGMIWPIGQTPGDRYATAMRSRERWLELASLAKIWLNPCGSLHAVYEDDENQVLQEFAAEAPKLGMSCQYLPGARAGEQYPVLVSDRLKGALYSPTECAVDPRQVIARLPLFLAERHAATLRFGKTVTHIDGTRVICADGETWQADQVLVCSGSDFETLFPAYFAQSGIRRCKLQMARTQPQSWKLPCHLAGGLTLTHYTSFQICKSLASVKARIAATMPDYVKYGIHVMASQNELGEIIIGDSHEYDQDIQIWDKSEIHDMILSYLKRMLRMPDDRISVQWHGIYAKHPTQSIVIQEQHPQCYTVVAPGGAGMTLSFGLAQEWWDQREGSR